jgi:hypothetical protein
LAECFAATEAPGSLDTFIEDGLHGLRRVMRRFEVVERDADGRETDRFFNPDTIDGFGRTPG